MNPDTPDIPPSPIKEASAAAVGGVAPVVAPTVVHARHPVSWMSVLALVVAALSLVLAGLIWQKLGFTQQELARRSQDSTEQAVEVRTVAKQAEALTQELQARLAVAEIKLSEVTLQRSQLEELMLALSRSRDDNLVQDIESALRLALQQTQLTGSVQPLVSALQAAKFAALPGLDPVVKRKLDMMRGTITLPAPTTDGAATELSTIATALSSQYGKGKGTLNGKEISGSDIEAEMGNPERTPAELSEMWASWHDNVGAPMKDDYTRMAAIANEGAKELGYADVGAMWRSGYDMDPAAFTAMTERLWAETRPLYESLHTYVRWKLNEKHGDAVQPKTGPIRADLLGNMWAQTWGNIYPLVAPAGSGDVGYDIGDLIVAKNMSEMDMVKTGEGFFSSLGFAPLPQTFYERSQFLKPRDREVVCHASAWDLDNKDDLRIKMCTKVNGDDFVTIHHELGHNYYQRAYTQKPYLYLNGANDGFHEAIGDAIALSITPNYLVQIGLWMLQRCPEPTRTMDYCCAKPWIRSRSCHLDC